MDRDRGVPWSCVIDIAALEEASHLFGAIVTDSSSKTLSCSIRFRKGKFGPASRVDIDQANAVGEWKERGILGTQPGPNKNGRKWWPCQLTWFQSQFSLSLPSVFC
jgi:Icc protein